MRDKLSAPSVVALVAFVSCGSPAPREEPAPTETPASEAPAATAEAAAACAFLTAEDIQEVLGKAPGAPQTPVGTEDCVWPSAEDPSTILLRLTTSDSGYASYDSFVASYQAEFGGEQPPTEYYRPIEGVGDWAMYVADENAIQVFKGARMVQIAPNPPNEAQALALAHKAAPRLP